MSDPGWLMEMAIEPHTRADQARLAEAMAELARDDLRFGYETDLESGQNIALANDEDVLNAVIDRLPDKYGIGMNASAPRVRYRETIRNGTSIDYMHASGHGREGSARASLFPSIRRTRLVVSRPGHGHAWTRPLPIRSRRPSGA